MIPSAAADAHCSRSRYTVQRLGRGLSRMNPLLAIPPPNHARDGDGRRGGPRHIELCIRTACAKVAANRAMWARTGAPTASRGCRTSPQGLARLGWRASRHLQALRTRGPRRRDGRTRNSSDEGHARTMATRSGKTAAVEKLVLGLSLRPCTYVPSPFTWPCSGTRSSGVRIPAGCSRRTAVSLAYAVDSGAELNFWQQPSLLQSFPHCCCCFFSAVCGSARFAF